MREKTNAPGFFALKTGTELNNRYLIGKTTGKGGFGIVYLAQDLKNKKIVAVKEYFPEGIAVRNADNITVEPLTSHQNDEFSKGVERFMNEARLVSEIDCDGIPTVFDCFRANGTACYVMEYANGINLRNFIERNGALTENETVFLIKSLAETLSVMHENHIIHRDISPENVILCRDGKIKLIDFGAARGFNENITSEMSVILKYGFAPPEQYRRKTHKGPFTDIYSLGALAYFAASGIIPEDSFSRLEDDSTFSAVCGKFSPALSEIVAKAAHVDTDSRYSNADELIAAIENSGIEAEKIAVPLSEIPAIHIKRRNRFIKPIIAIASVIAVAVTVIFAANYINNAPEQAYTDEIPAELRIGDDYFPVDSEELDLSDRELTNNQIANLKHFKNLKTLKLNDNFITDLSALSGLVGLKELYFSNNAVNDLAFLENINGLEKLTAVNNNIKDISVLSDMTELRNVYLQDNFITDISALKNCEKLKYIGFDENQLRSVEALRDKAELKQVCFSGCNLTDITPLETCPKLDRIYLGRNKITDFTPLKGCKYIRELILDNNGITDETVKTLYGLNVPGYIDLAANYVSEEAAFALSDNITGGGIVYY